MNELPIFFVWINGLRGPSPQIWHGEKTADGQPVRTLFKRRLEGGEQLLSLAELQAKYPAPEVPE